MTLQVMKAGLLTTVQDLGRQGCRQYGVSVGGAMDELSHRLANTLVGNHASAATLEMTMIGAGFQVQEEITIAVCGADMDGTVDSLPLPMWRPVRIAAGSRLRFAAAVDGCRTVLATAGGFAVPLLLGSRSTALRSGFGGMEGRALREGDTVRIASTEGAGICAKSQPDRSSASSPYTTVKWFAGNEWRSTEMNRTADGIAEIRVTEGCEWDRFTEGSKRKFLQEAYTLLPQSDRMGTRLEGAELATTHKEDMLSDAVTLGTVQVPPDGRPIVLMADRQTTGGYPRVAQVAAVDIPSFAQLRPGTKVRFRLISNKLAQELYLTRMRSLERLRAVLSMKSTNLERG